MIKGVLVVLLVACMTWAYARGWAELWWMLLAYTVFGIYLERGYQYLRCRGVVHTE